MTKEHLMNIADKVFHQSSASETEVVITVTDEALTRFANNEIHQNVARNDISLTVRVFQDQRMAESATNQMDDESLRAVTERALDAVKVMPPDPSLLPRLGPQTYTPIHAVDDRLLSVSPQERADSVVAAIERCRAENLTAAGAHRTAFTSLFLANSNGLVAFYERTDRSFSITVFGEDGTGWASVSSFRWDDADPHTATTKAIEKAKRNRNPIELPPGVYRVVLEPSAVADLIIFLSVGFDALSVYEKRSWLTGRVGQKLFGENITLVSDISHPLHQGCPFDAEGYPTKKVVLIDKGVATNLVYDRVTAHRLGQEPTGHSVDPKGAFGAFPRGLVLVGGQKTLDDLIRETDKGLLITRLWYIGTVDPMKVLLTGLTRDGVFLIEKGEVTRAVKNFRFNQSVLDLLNSVEAMSEAERAGAPEWEWAEVVPAMRVSEFHLTDVTGSAE
ncbi:MAG: TldD/PmbA family protein [Armatimonadetes bacterium]|nr:TldD/PmbA family protein [Armatimonadota bacterium]MDW8121550.1 TldD/PmbA family protein [Armatimonadota bacterium]